MPVKVFISYKYQDKGRNQWVEKLYKDLRDAGIEAKHEKYEVAPGDSFSDYMTREISQCDYVLFIVTPNAVEAVESGKGALAFEMEISNARRMSGKDDFRIIPIFREGDRTSAYLSDHRYIDFMDDAEYESSLNELLGWLKGEVKAPALGSSDNFFSVNKTSHNIILLDPTASKNKAAQLSSVYRHLTSLGLDGKKIVRLHWAADSPPLTHKFGREIDDPSALNERALYSEGWEGPLDDGLLFWGPYEALPEKGSYAAVFRMKVTDNGSQQPILRIDVHSNSMPSIIVSRNISGADFDTPDDYKAFSLNFENKGSDDVEYRVRKLFSSLEVWVDYVAVVATFMNRPLK